jgi:hypothetical protein
VIERSAREKPPRFEVFGGGPDDIEDRRGSETVAAANHRDGDQDNLGRRREV